MSSSDRRTFLGFLAGAPLAACGFAPAYGPGGPATPLRGRIEADAPVTRDGFTFVSGIEARFGRADAPAYRLSYQITTQRLDLAITPEGSILRYNFIGTVAFQVIDTATGATLFAGSADSFTASAATRSTIAAASSETDAADRLMRILADQVATKLIASAATWASL